MIRLLRYLATQLRGRPVLGRLALSLIPDLQRTIDVRGFGPVAIRLRRNRSLWLRDYLAMEAFPLAMLKALTKRDDAFYDIGANVGLYSRFACSQIGVRAVAFEPVRENLELLRKNLLLGGVSDRVTVLEFAIGETDGSVEFQLDDMQSVSGTLSVVSNGQASLGRRLLGLPPLATTVACRRLPTAIADNGLPTPDIIKIDVEGAESLVVDGAEEYLAEHRPKLLIELHGAEVAGTVASKLLRIGYAVRGKVDTRIDPSGFATIDLSIAADLRGLYDLHYLVAAADASELPISWSDDSAAR